MELLSPAGSKAALKAAVQSGADAVYLGGNKFGARSGAENFSFDEMKKWIDYCHLYDVKCYVTVNTLLKEKELGELSEYLKNISDAGADAVLIQDLGVLSVLKMVAPNLPYHASTQMTATSLDDVLFLEKLGFERVVLSRELSFDEIKYIKENCHCELEIFVHGAICMCYSGQCLMSSIIGGRSGNRGRCAQPCRLPYTVVDENDKKLFEGFALSPKDLCLIRDIDRLKKIGVDSLKIEGRLKRAEYVACVTSIYKKHINEKLSVSKSEINELKNAFGRGFTSGLFGGEKGKKMMSFENSSNVADNSFTDEVKRLSGENANFRKIKVEIKVKVNIARPLSIEISDGKNRICKSSEFIVERALNKPTGYDRVKQSVLKLGSTPYECTSIDIDIDEDAMVPISEINNIRRIACDELSEKRIYRDKRETFDYTPSGRKEKDKTKPIIVCDVQTEEQYKACKKCGIEIIYAPSVFKEKSRGIIVKCAEVTKSDDSVGDNLCVSNLGEIKNHQSSKLFGGVRLNVTNSESAKIYGKYLENIILSSELRAEELRDITSKTNVSCGIIAYGRLELMLCENCPLKSIGLCQNKLIKYSLKDRMGEKFPLMCSEHCQLKVLNSKPLYIADKIDKFLDTDIAFYSLVFTTEGYDECVSIIESYKRAIDGEKADTPPDNTFTRGHYFRGVQ